MPLEGPLVKQHIVINFLDRTGPILDVSFRTGLLLGMIDNGDQASVLVNPATQHETPLMMTDGTDVDAILVPGTKVYDQAKLFFNRTVGDGLVLFASERAATPAATELSTAMGKLNAALDVNTGTGTAGLGWPYLTFTNTDDPADVAEMSDFISAEERIFFADQERDADLDAMANAAKTAAVSMNSPRTVLCAHTGDDTNLDGIPDADASLAAAAASFIAENPVGGWEIFAKNPIGLPPSLFNNTQRLTLENGAPGISGAITSFRAFGLPAFSTNNTTAGTFIDITQAKDFLAFKLRQAIWLRLRNYNKIPFTPRGFDIIRSAIEEVYLANTEDPTTLIGIIRRLEDNLPDYDIFMPRLKDIPLAERVNRHLTPVNSRIGYTGSVLKVTNNIVLEV